MAEAKKTTKKAKAATSKKTKKSEKQLAENETIKAVEVEISEEKPAAADQTESVTENVQAEGDQELEDSKGSEETEESKTTKAGKRSAKSLKEAAEKQAKEERKVSGEASEKPKVPVKPARSRLERRGKLFRKSAELIEKGKTYGISEAIDLAKKTSHVKFDATVELHVNLSVDPKVADQNVRDNLVLPAGSGRNVRVAVLAEEADTAKKAGADFAGVEEILADLEKGTLNFDILIATPSMMPRLGKYARVLGPRGLMPNPKSGTVTTDIEKAVSEAKAGRVEYRVDSTGIVHLGVGKVSFEPAKLQDNIQAVLTSIKGNKPNSVKSNYIKSIYISTTMGPSITVDVTSID